MTGQGASQNATLFVMTSEISNAPNIGFTQAGGFNAVAMHNPAGWYGLALRRNFFGHADLCAQQRAELRTASPTASYTL